MPLTLLIRCTVYIYRARRRYERSAVEAALSKRRLFGFVGSRRFPTASQRMIAFRYVDEIGRIASTNDRWNGRESKRSQSIGNHANVLSVWHLGGCRSRSSGIRSVERVTYSRGKIARTRRTQELRAVQDRTVILRGKRYSTSAVTLYQEVREPAAIILRSFYELYRRKTIVSCCEMNRSYPTRVNPLRSTFRLLLVVEFRRKQRSSNGSSNGSPDRKRFTRLEIRPSVKIFS